MFSTSYNELEETLETVSLPITGKTIIIDAGHGIPDEGDCLLTLIENN
jgi:N-acetylmuramoyl-L-alanine amidase